MQSYETDKDSKDDERPMKSPQLQSQEHIIARSNELENH